MKRIFLQKPINPNLSIYVALRKSFGINLQTAGFILKQFHLSYPTKLQNISERKLKQIEDFILKGFPINEVFTALLKTDFKKLREAIPLRYIKYRLRLPVNGQRTHTNARIAKFGR